MIGCRDATGPGFGIAVSVTAVVGPSLGTDYAGNPIISCDVGLQAAASGSGHAEWMDAVFYFYLPNNRTTPADSSLVPAATIRGSWQHDVIAADSIQRAGWTLSAGVPFVVTIAFSYQVAGGPLETTKVSAVCEPQVPAGAAPTITGLASDTSSRLEPGKYLTLLYSATSPVGLWETAVHLGGPCDTTLYYPDSLQHTIVRSTRIFLPPSCSLGVPLVATVALFDADAQTAERSLVLPSLVDTTPPTIAINLGLSPPSGDYFAGDSIPFLFGAWDNHALQSLHWTILPSGSGDSVPVTGSWTSLWLYAHTTDGLSGPIQLSFFARDAQGNVSPSVQTAPDAIRVYPSATPAVTNGTITNGVDLWTWDARRGLVYGTYDFSALIFRVATNSGVTSSLAWAHDYTSTVGLSPGGDSLVLMLPLARSLAFLDLRPQGQGIGRVTLGDVDSTYGFGTLAVMANGKILIPVQNAAGVGHIYAYDLATGAVTLRTDAGDGGDTGAGQLGVSPDGAVAVLNGGPGKFQRYDAATDRFGPLATARSGGQPQVANGGSVVAVGGDFYDGSLQYLHTTQAVATMQMAGRPHVLSPDGQVLYLGYGYGVVRIRVSDDAIVDRLRLPLEVDAGLSVSPDGTTLLAQEQTLSGSIDRIALATVPALPAGATLARQRPFAPGRAGGRPPSLPSPSAGGPWGPRAPASR